MLCLFLYQSRFIWIISWRCTFFIHLIKWAQVGLWWAHPRDIPETSTAKSYIILVFVYTKTHLAIFLNWKKNCVFLSIIQSPVQNELRSLSVVGWLVKMWCSIFFEDCPFRLVLLYCKSSGQSSKKMSIALWRLSAQSMSVSLFFNFCAQKTSKERRQPL